MLSLVISTIVFFVASFFLKRYLEDMGIPKGFARKVGVFCLAILAAYAAAAAVDWIVLHV
jgi:hypothetical protein